jgi:hypothetical protein
MSKATKATIQALEVHSNIMKHCTDFIRIKKKYPKNQTTYGKEHSKDYFIGMADAMNHFMESILFNNKCYGGFRYVREDCKTCIQTLEDPEYAEWRRVYFIK